MLKNQPSEYMKKSYRLFYSWFFLNAMLFLLCNILTGFTLLAQGAEDSINLIGLLSGGFIGLLIGLMQWLILRRYFSTSPLWIVSCIIGFALYYAVNWYLGAILMGIFQQFLLRRRMRDSFLWFAAAVLGLGASGLMLLRPEALCLSGAVYGLPTGVLLTWYQNKLQSERQGEAS